MLTHGGRLKLDSCGTYRLVRVLRGLSGLVGARRCRAIFLAVLFNDKHPCGGLSLLGDAL